MKRLILLFIIITGCSLPQNKDINQNIKFSDSLTLEEFKIKLEEYTNNSPYPNIDN